MAVTVGTSYSGTTYLGDSQGWTTLTPSGTWQNGFNTGAPASGTSMVLYVSSTGSDLVTATEGSSSSPYATVAHALSKLRDGEPDWILLKKGDTFTGDFGQLITNGKSSTEPQVIASYSSTGIDASHPRGTGTGARPLISTNQTSAALIRTSGGGSGLGKGDLFALVGIEFYCPQRDPTNGAFTNTNIIVSAMNLLNPFTWWLMEDCKFTYMSQCSVEPSTGTGGTFYCRRNIFNHCWGVDTGSGGYAQGIYFDVVSSPILEENIFAYIGADSRVTGSIQTYHDHCHYLNETCGPCINKGQISVLGQGQADLMTRCGGTIYDNLVDTAGVGQATWGHGTVSPAANLTYANTTISYCVFLHLYTYATAAPLVVSSANGGNAIPIASGAVSATYNICAVANANNSNPAISITGASPGPAASNCVVQNNIIYQYNGGTITDNGTSDTISNNDIEGAGPHVGTYPYPDAARSPATYMGTIGGTATLAGFAAAVMGQSADNWDTRITANAVNNYIRAGFGFGTLVHRGGKELGKF